MWILGLMGALVLLGTVGAVASNSIANKIFEKKLIEQGFIVSKKVVANGSALFIDDVHRKWAIREHMYARVKIFDYRDLHGVEINKLNDQLHVRIQVNDLEKPERIVKMLIKPARSDSWTYRMAYQSAKDFAANLNYIQNNAYR